MSSSPAPKDNSAEMAKIEAEAARQAREEAAKQAAEQRARFEGSVGSAYSSAIDDAKAYFISRGLNPDDYIGSIQRGATSARNRIPDLASAPGTYFDNLGATVYDTERGAKRGTLQRDINSFAPEGFATRRIANDSDDATLESILQEQRGTADSYLRNLLDRGVINASGYAAGGKDLDTQSYGARSRLQEIGNQQLEKGRGEATNVANEARSRASNYELGDSFDPFEYGGRLNDVFSNFFANLGGDIRSKVPSGLFSTSGLANIAGAGQGAQNLKFDPNAIAGVNDDEEDDNTATNNLLSAF